MAGNLLRAARSDAKKYLINGGFQEDIRLSVPDGSQFIDTKGFKSKHHLGFDSDGNAINSKNVHICINEDVLVSAGYPVRNPNGEVDLLNHLVEAPDSSGETKNYIVVEHFPDGTLGAIVCILGDYNQN